MTILRALRLSFEREKIAFKRKADVFRRYKKNFKFQKEEWEAADAMEDERRAVSAERDELKIKLALTQFQVELFESKSKEIFDKYERSLAELRVAQVEVGQLKAENDTREERAESI
jgi:hypothetical protein